MNKLSRLAISEDGFIFDPNTGQSFTTNKTGIFILKLLQKDIDETKITEAIVEEFDTNKDEAQFDLEDFLEKLHSYSLT